MENTKEAAQNILAGLLIGFLCVATVLLIPWVFSIFIISISKSHEFYCTATGMQLAREAPPGSLEGSYRHCEPRPLPTPTPTIK